MSRMDELIDPRVVSDEAVCPAQGFVHRGRVTGSDIRHTIFLNEASIAGCVTKAGALIDFWQKYKNYNRGEDVPRGAEFGTGDWYRMKAIAGRQGLDPTRAYVSFFAVPETAPAGMQCVVNFSCGGVDASEENAIAFRVDRETNLSNASGRKEVCQIPLMENECMTNKILGKAPRHCTGLTAEGIFGANCRSWFDSLPKDTGPVTRAGVVQAVCERYPFLAECMCQSRELDDTYLSFKSKAFNTVSDVCWYMPCKMSGRDRLVTPLEDESRNSCNNKICGAFVDITNSTNINLDELKNMINCTEEEWEQAAGGGTTPAPAPAPAPGDGGSDIGFDDWFGSSPTTGGSGSGSGSDSDSGANGVFLALVIGAIVIVGIVAIALIVWVVRFFWKSGKKTKT